MSLVLGIKVQDAVVLAHDSMDLPMRGGATYRYVPRPIHIGRLTPNVHAARWQTSGGTVLIAAEQTASDVEMWTANIGSHDMGDAITALITNPSAPTRVVGSFSADGPQIGDETPGTTQIAPGRPRYGVGTVKIGGNVGRKAASVLALQRPQTVEEAIDRCERLLAAAVSDVYGKYSLEQLIEAHNPPPFAWPLHVVVVNPTGSYYEVCNGGRRKAA